MALPQQPAEGPADGRSRTPRGDAVESRNRILAAAAELAGDRRVSMAEIAAAAGVARATVYRHFATKAALLDALAHAGEADPVPEGTAVPASGLVPLAPRPPGRLG